MFFDGVGGYTPPPTPNEYNLSLGCETEALIPTSDITVNVLTLCGISYLIADEYATQSDLLAFLNSVFISTFGLIGSFFIDSNELIYSTPDECDGVYCIGIEIKLQTDDGIDLQTDDGDQLTVD